MREFFRLSFRLFTVFGISVRVHILYVFISAALILRVAYQSYDPNAWIDVAIMLLVLLFGSILLHEFGHSFMARRVGGDSEEILMWPLGGLAFCDVPHDPRSHFLVAAAGPAVNVGLCLACSGVLALGSFVPPLNPLSSPYHPVLYNWAEARDFKADGDFILVDKATEERLDGTVVQTDKGYAVLKEERGELPTTVQAKIDTSLGELPGWALWTARLFWVNWVLLLFNMSLVGFPMDAGRMLQSVIWGRTDDYRRGTVTAVYAGYVVAGLLVFIVFAGFGGPILFALALFIAVSCFQQKFLLDSGMEDSPYGDFSQGYTSLTRGEDAEERRRRRRPNFIRRWLQRRAARRLQREHERRAADQERLDELLAKINREGRESLTDEERRFLTRVSEQYRNNPS